MSEQGLIASVQWVNAMMFEVHTLEAIRFRADATGDAFMTVSQVEHDLGGPADFYDVLSNLHALGMITLHQGSGALSLTYKGRQVRLPRTTWRRW